MSSRGGSGSVRDFAKAIAKGDTKLVKKLLSRGAINIDAMLPSRDEYATPVPPLVLAAERNRPKIVEILLQANASVDIVSGSGSTACHMAAACGHVDVLAVLIAAGADLEAGDEIDETPLMVAIGSHQDEAAAAPISTASTLCRLRCAALACCRYSSIAVLL
jgi:ankyrin repeat protein